MELSGWTIAEIVEQEQDRLFRELVEGEINGASYDQQLEELLKWEEGEYKLLGMEYVPRVLNYAV